MKKTLAALAILTLSLPAFAHGPMGPHFGGQLADAGDWHVEFAVRDGAIRAWVRDHSDAPVAATGKATLLSGGKKIELSLVADEKGLIAVAPVTSADKVTAILSLSVNGKPVSARFMQDAVKMPAKTLPGAALFAENCAVCHGQSLRGTDAGPPLLHPYYAPGAGHGDDMLLASIANGTKAHHWKFGDMPKPEGLMEGQEKDVLAFIRAMQEANGFGAPVMVPSAAPIKHGLH